MPRRYRPPTRRRRPKKERLAEETSSPPHSDALASAPPPPPIPRPPPVEREGHAEVKHIARDHSYVLAELRLIAVIVTFIVLGLIITAILR